ncbi:uncharacterized protein LOC124123059 [Haliotis rufescens]|uniref:uncharacterized protein LOC124123059 n=1 Tax=Haliotis rufescens TaxID=6454 RepID=UPI001EB04EBA|nr:uncharacterized protein LOC124123059 [Haliotis rufescens]
MRKRAREETTPIQQLYNQQIAEEDDDQAQALPAFPSMSSALYRHRRKTIPVLPQTRAQVDLDDAWSHTSDGDCFLLFSDGEENIILAFATDGQLQILQGAETIYMDDTLNRELAPTRLQTDFEQAAIPAIQLEFPNAEVKCCFFHYSQAIWRKTQDLGLAVAYKEDQAVQQWIRRAADLALLPADDVQDYDARFPILLWNHNDTTGPRTNNNLEGFHNKLNRSLPHQHPNIYRLIEVFRMIEKAVKVKLAQINLGAPEPSRKRVYREVDNRLQRLKDQLTEGRKSPIQFLDAAGHLLKLG